MIGYNILPNRSFITISSEDRISFFDGLIPLNLKKAISQINMRALYYSFMLTPQGKYLFDFFLFLETDKLIIDIDSRQVEDFMQKITRYKLSSQVEFTISDYRAAVLFDQYPPRLMPWRDERHHLLGYRVLLTADDANNYPVSDETYQMRRILARIAEGERSHGGDFTAGRSFVIHFGYDKIADAISFDKGCYIGQEVTARMHHLSNGRKHRLTLEVCPIDDEDKLSSFAISPDEVIALKLHLLKKEGV